MMRSLLPALILTLCAHLGCTRGEPTIYAIAVHPQKPRIIYAATDLTVFKSQDGGKNWERRGEGLEGARVISLGIDPQLTSTIYAGTFATAVYKSVDGAQRWRPANIGLKEHVSVVNAIIVDPNDSDIVFMASTVGPYRSTNAGGSWTEIVHGMESVYAVDIAFDPTDSKTLYAGTSGGMYRSDNRGDRWEIINKGLIEGEVDVALSMGVNSIAIDPARPQHLFIGTTKGLFATASGGREWAERNQGLEAKFINRVLLDPEDRDTLYAGTGKGVFKSGDRAATWAPADEGLTSRVIRSMVMDPSDPKTLYAGTQKGLFKTSDGAQTWTLVPLKSPPPQ